MPHDIFISHSSVDLGIAGCLCDALESFGLSCWISGRNLPPGGIWPEELVRAIEGSTAFVILLTPASNCSAHVSRELAIAQKSHKLILPLRISHFALSAEIEYRLVNTHIFNAGETIEDKIRLFVIQVNRCFPWARDTAAIQTAPGQPVDATPPLQQSTALPMDSVSQYERALELLANPGRTASALELLRRSADANYSPAIVKLARVMVDDFRKGGSEGTAIQCLNRAAELGDVWSGRILKAYRRVGSLSAAIEFLQP